MDETMASPKSVTNETLITSLNNNTGTTDSIITGNVTQFSMHTDGSKDEANNSSFVSVASDSQRSISAAPCSSSSPILSPHGKLLGKNANGTTITTSKPKNEAEIQLYRVLQRASLLAYYDTLLEMGGDDVGQLYEAGEEEFLEIMALVGMASKPLHVRRLQKVLHEWANNPSIFQGPFNQSFWETPTKINACAQHELLGMNLKSPTLVHQSSVLPMPLTSTSKYPSTFFPQICTNAASISVTPPRTSIGLLNTLASSSCQTQATNTTAHHVSSSSPQLTPFLTESQVSLITEGAENIARHLPQREPRAQTSKKRTSRELEQVITMNENDPRRMEEIRKYSAIYGRFDCKRRPEKLLTLHEVCVNEAAAQLCRLVPALLTRRDELFPLARKVVRNVGFGYSANIARYSLPSQSRSESQPSLNEVVDYDSTNVPVLAKKQRLTSAETEVVDTERVSPEYNNRKEGKNVIR